MNENPPSIVEDDSFWFPTELLKPEHRERIGHAIHLLLLFVDLQQHGMAYTDELASGRLGAPISTIRKWRTILEGSGYMPRQVKAGCVYLIQAENGLYKIGMTIGSAKQRLETLQTGSPVRLELCHTIPASNPIDLERQLHTYFSAKHHHGEWFALSQDDVEYIMDIRGE